MRALLLAAGLGTRLRPITDHVPKCLVPIHGKPLLGYWLDMLFPNGVERVLVNTHYLPEVVREFVAVSTWQDSIDMVHEDELLGTGGTVLKNRDFLAGGPFMVVHADNLTRFDVRAFIHAHECRPSGIDITMMTFDTDAPSSCGIVELDDRGVVVGFHEKVAVPPSNHANAAVYIFEPSVIDSLASLGKTVVDISTEVLPQYLGRMQAFHNTLYHRDIGTLESLTLAEREFRLTGF
jgi:mannose-1-phosphate guanylyltransferase